MNIHSQKLSAAFYAVCEDRHVRESFDVLLGYDSHDQHLPTYSIDEVKEWSQRSRWDLIEDRALRLYLGNVAESTGENMKKNLPELNHFIRGMIFGIGLYKT